MYTKYVLIIAAGLVMLGVGLWITATRTSIPRACTTEAKFCPDGSAVGRTGPNCEFAPCPTQTATTTTGGGSGGVLPYQSGITGKVLLGPTCPVERIPPDPNCADKPYATAIVVYREGSKTPFVIGNSDSSGIFSFSLPPGSYTLSAGSGSTLPRCSAASLTVPPKGYTNVNISCDTGIR